MAAARLSSASFAYPAVPSGERAVLAARVAGGLGGVAPRPFLLSTCLRLEVAVPGDGDDLARILKEVFAEAADVPGVEIRHDADAVEHLFRVSAGLESPIVGEREIWTQFRQAVARAEEEGLADGTFVRVLERAVAIGRQARALLPHSPYESMAAVAAQAVGAAERVAVFGSGVMGTAVVDALARLPVPPEVTVATRRPESVSAVPDGLPAFGVRSLADAEDILASFPAVVSATSAKTRLVASARLADILRRRTEPLVLVDMAMPPDFAPEPGLGVTYVDIDELAGRAAHLARSDAADEHVSAAAADAFHRYAGHHEVGPVIRGLFDRADGVVADVVDRFAGRLADPADREVLRQAVHTATRTLLAAPVGYVNRADRGAVDVVAESFGVDA